MPTYVRINLCIFSIACENKLTAKRVPWCLKDRSSNRYRASEHTTPTSPPPPPPTTKYSWKWLLVSRHVFLIDYNANVRIKLNERERKKMISRAGNFIGTLLNYDIFTFWEGKSCLAVRLWSVEAELRRFPEVGRRLPASLCSTQRHSLSITSPRPELGMAMNLKRLA